MEDVSDVAAINPQHSFHLRKEMRAAIMLCHLSIKHFLGPTATVLRHPIFQRIEICITLPIMQNVCGGEYAPPAL